MGCVKVCHSVPSRLNDLYAGEISMVVKSERLKKLESELNDLEQWLKLGLVPKRDIEKHSQEIEALKQKIADENNRIQELKESGDADEFVPPKRGAQGRQVYQDSATLPGIDMEADNTQESSMDMETESYDTQSTTMSGTEEKTSEYTLSDEEEEEDPFSDKNRWKRGILEDPDGDQW